MQQPQQPATPEVSQLSPPALLDARPLVPKAMPQLVPSMLSLLKAIEPDTIYAGYDGTLPDTSTRLMTTLNRLGGRQVISAVKWAKALPGTERGTYAHTRTHARTHMLQWHQVGQGTAR